MSVVKKVFFGVFLGLLVGVFIAQVMADDGMITVSATGASSTPAASTSGAADADASEAPSGDLSMDEMPPDFALGIDPNVTAALPGLYLEADVGLAFRNWVSMYFWHGANWGDFEHATFGALVDLGYEWNRYFSIEGGWIYLMAPSMNNFSGLSWGRSDASSWSTYVGGKLQIPMCANIFLYGKLAAAYSEVHFTNTGGGHAEC